MGRNLILAAGLLACLIPAGTIAQDYRKTVTVEVYVPEAAQLFIEGQDTMSQGTMRRFVSPPLPPGPRRRRTAPAHSQEPEQAEQAAVLATATVDEPPIPETVDQSSLTKISPVSEANASAPSRNFCDATSPVPLFEMDIS